MAGSARSTTWCAALAVPREALPFCPAGPVEAQLTQVAQHGQRSAARWRSYARPALVHCLHMSACCLPRVLTELFPVCHALPQEIFWTKLQESEAAGQPPEVS